jgi:hypothetical protein
VRSTDPEFEMKGADVIGVYLDPHAGVVLHRRKDGTISESHDAV